MTKVGDVVLVHMDNTAFFARVEEISADVKPGWFHVKLLVLQIPLLVVTWILREPYYNGEEFTMGGRPMRIEKVVAPAEEDATPEPEDKKKSPTKPELVAPRKEKQDKSGKQGNVISISDHRKKDKE
ncbi:MAG: hypothetical protein ACLQBD_17915 [Syntrophobacteraceae bacterium]